MNVVIVGGGIAGLSAAWTLANAADPPHITVLESSSRFGGKIQTTPFAGLPVDNGPDAFLSTVPAAKQLCEELDIAESLIAPSSSKSWIWSRGTLRNFPLGTVLGVPSNVFSLANVISLKGMARTTLDLVLPRHIGRVGADPSIGELIRGRLGDEIADRLIDPLIGNINAGSIDSLSMKSSAPQVLELSNSHRSLLIATQKKAGRGPKGPKRSAFLAPRQGMQSLVDTLVQRLGEKGVELRTEQSVASLAHNGKWQVVVNDEALQTDAVVLATPASNAASLVRDINTHASTLLASIRYASVSLVRLTYNKTDVGHSLEGSGFVVPAADKTMMTACSWASSKWQRLSLPDQVVFRVSAGRFHDTRAQDLDDTVLVKTLHEELRQALRITGEPTSFDVTRWTDAFPQYEPGHSMRVQQARKFLERAERATALELAGSSYDGVGIPACIQSGKSAAERLLAESGANGA